MKKLLGNGLALATIAVFLLSMTAFGQDDSDLAKKLANPVASLISVPIQVNYDENFGPNEEGSVWKINIQPVILSVLYGEEKN